MRAHPQAFAEEEFDGEELSAITSKRLGKLLKRTPGAAQAGAATPEVLSRACVCSWGWSIARSIFSLI